MHGLFEPGWLTLGVFVAAGLFTLRWPPPPRLGLPIGTLVLAGLVIETSAIVWWTTHDPRVHWISVLAFYAGVGFAFPAWLWLAARMSEVQGHPSRLGGRRWVQAYFGASALLWALLATNPWHGWLLTPRPGARSEFHALFFAGLAVPALEFALASGLYLRLARRVRSSTVRLRSLGLCLAGLLTFAGAGVDTLSESGELFSAMQVSNALAVLLALAGIYGGRLFALSPLGIHLAIQHQHDGLLLVDEEDRLLYANPAARRLLEPASLEIDMPVYDELSRWLRAPDGAGGGTDFAPEALSRRVRDGSRIGAGALVRSGPRWLRITETPIPGPGGRVRARSLLLEDHTALQRAGEAVEERERALRASEERYRVLFDEAPLGVVVLDPDFTIASINRAALHLIGAPDASIAVGRSPLQHAPGRDPEIVAAAERVRETGQPVSFDTRWKSFFGKEVEVRAHLAPLSDSSGRRVAYQVILEDVSEQRRLQEQLIQSQKMEAVGRLAGGIAHDFNNYLTVILGNAEMLRAEVRDDPLAGPLAEVAEAAERSARLTRQLLAFSRRQVFEPQVVDVDRLIEGLVPMLSRMLGERIHIDLRPADEPLCAHVDPSQLEVVLVNLAINARDAMPEGGVLRIRSEGLDVAADHPERPADQAPGEYVRIEVGDTGSGMNEETRERVFEPFFTTKERGRGTGLGLSTVYGIVRQSGGFVTVESAEARGSRFRVHLPRAAGSTPAHPSPSRPETAPSGDARILLVEDEERVRAFLRGALEGHGYEVVEAADAETALERMAAAEAPEIDLLVSDVILPGLDGLELAGRLRADRPALRVLFISGFSDPARTRERIRELGADYLQKPFTGPEIAERVAQCLARDAGSEPAG